MKILLLVLLLPLVYSENTACTAYGRNLEKYKRTTIVYVKGLPTNLAYHRNTQSLYFTLIDLETLQDDNVQTKMEQFVLKDNDLIKIDTVNGQAVVVDEKNNTVYVATDKGLYTLDEFYEPKYLSLKDEDIVQLFKPDNRNEIYAIIYPENSVYLYNLDRNQKTFVKKINSAFIIALDNDNNIYYECESKYVKVLLDGFQEPVEYVGLGKNTARALAMDDGGKIYLAASDGLYKLLPTNVIPIKFMDLDFVPSGLAFDGGDIFVATTGVIYKYSSC